MIHFPIESLNLQMLNVGLARHNGDWNWQHVSSPFIRIYLVTEGTARLHLPSGVTTLRSGRLYIVPPYTLHSYECQGVFEHEARLPESNPQAYDNTTSFTDYAKRYNALPLGQKMRLRGTMLMLFSRFMQKATPRVWTGDERLTKVLDYINNHLYDEIDIGELAGVACVSKAYLIRLFKHEFGQPPLQYINRKKTEKAQLLLLTTDMPVKDVAYTLGVSDLSYFIRLFKKHSGTTPQEYRLSMR